MSNKKIDFKIDDHVIVHPGIMSDPDKAKKITNRTGLTGEELSEPMRVIHTTEDQQIHIKHKKLKRTLIVHSKFMTHASPVSTMS
ncbi:MAG: hypothetical protein KBC41_03190 [Candidatus Pacebacteria bacterium]|nr:hypothetical protein [Candidatus Paceibacterota bacterium]MBP9867052.1 hypothetical protein [Candidatus Paceibacterota bacterium]